MLLHYHVKYLPPFWLSGQFHIFVVPCVCMCTKIYDRKVKVFSISCSITHEGSQIAIMLVAVSVRYQSVTMFLVYLIPHCSYMMLAAWFVLCVRFASTLRVFCEQWACMWQYCCKISCDVIPCFFCGIFCWFLSQISFNIWLCAAVYNGMSYEKLCRAWKMWFECALPLLVNNVKCVESIIISIQPTDLLARTFSNHNENF